MSSANHAGAPLTPAVIFEMLQAHQRTSALKAAIDLDIFRAVGEGPGDVASIARHCKASERGIRILCDFLVVCGVLSKENGLYKHTPTSAAFLDPRSPACMASIAQFLANPAMQEPYQKLAEIVRTGRTILPGDGTVEPENPVWVQFAETMGPMMGPWLARSAQLCSKEAPAPCTCSTSQPAMASSASRSPNRIRKRRVTGLDWAPVLRVALENARKAGVHDRYNMLPGSAFEVDYGGPYDAVLLTNFLHHFDQPTNVTLLKKVRAALKPGGRAATLEFVPNEDRVSPPMPAAFSLTMLTSTAAGDAYTLSELTAMYNHAGFSGITAHPIPMSPHTVVMGLA